MLKEALEYLTGQSHKFNEARLLSIPGSDGRQAYVDQKGELSLVPVPPALRGHNVDSVDDLIAAAGRWNAKPVIWISGESVVLIADDEDRRDRVTLKLHKSSQFACLIALAKKPELDQVAMLRTLRIDLPGTAGRTELIATIRKIKWRTSAGGESNITHGGESLGKQIEAEVTAAGNIPESLLVSCPVYRNPGEREQSFTVNCDLDILPHEQVFRLCPLPDEIERVTEAALAGIRDRIEGELKDVAVFYGTP